MNEVTYSTLPWISDVRYMRLVNDGTNIKGYMSRDGLKWTSLSWTATLASFISSIDRIGFTMDVEDGANGSESIVVEWFRRYA